MPKLTKRVEPPLIPGEIPEFLSAQMKAIASKSPEEEICGFVCYDEGKWFLKLIKNAHKDKKHAFKMDFDEQYQYVMLALETIAGVFHTHPSGDIRRSPGDIAGFSFATGWRYWIATASQVVEYEAGSSGVSPKHC